LFWPGTIEEGVVTESELAGQFTPLLAAMGLELYDVELASANLRVTVSRDGGVDLDTLAAASVALSAWLDEHDPMPGRYNLEVSSPGLERRLRTRAQFEGAVGQTVTLRIAPPDVAAERVTGTLVHVDDDGLELTTDAGPRAARFDEVERARTVFVWGSAPKPSPSRGRPRSKASATRKA
jgi:ribosome maturation factor RimP